ncbi:hypothetical protein NQ314_007377 [Rhamnusium bicolor]|uniref:Transposase n=1 Tax=Rhamnusium bicolor TaxID=1586634 RepID=A0AAV8YPL7_9CUCU|nr:hypothetical protein NQ314_007377 [Rhamnusium bicolor]
MFIDTLAISDKWITTICKKMDSHETSCIYLNDRCGHHVLRPNKIPDELKDTMENGDEINDRYEKEQKPLQDLFNEVSTDEEEDSYADNDGEFDSDENYEPSDYPSSESEECVSSDSVPDQDTLESEESDQTIHPVNRNVSPVPSDTDKSRYGIKFFELTTSDGYLLNLEMYSGAVTDDSENSKTEAVVLRLMKLYLNKGHELFMDNYYNSYELSEKLLNLRTHTNGTLNSRRKSNPQEVIKKKLKKREHFWVRLKRVYVSKWKGKRDVLVITTRNHPRMISVKNKFGKEQIKSEEVSTYNNHMWGIDQCDQMTSTYSTPRKTLRWYKKVLFHLLDVTVWNAFYLYRKFAKNDSRKYRFLQYSDELIRSLIQIPDNLEGKHLISRQKHDNRRPGNALFESEPTPQPIDSSAGSHWPEKILVDTDGKEDSDYLENEDEAIFTVKNKSWGTMSVNKRSIPNIEESPGPSGLQRKPKEQKLTSFLDHINPDEQSELTKHSCDAVYSSNCALSMFESEKWKKFFEKWRPTFEIPKQIKTQVKTQLNDEPTVSIMSDGWSNIRNEGIINYMVHTSKGDLFYDFSLPKAQKHTGVAALMTDNAANMRAAWVELKVTYPTLQTYGCASHTLNLVMKDMESITTLLELSSEENEVKVIGEITNFRTQQNIFNKPIIWAASKGVTSQCKTSSNVTPATWWKNWFPQCPLHDVAVKLLSMPAFAASCERNWSAWGIVHSKIRNRLKTTRSGKLMYIKYNLKLVNSYEKYKENTEKLNFSSDSEGSDSEAEDYEQVECVVCVLLCTTMRIMCRYLI